MKTSTFALVSLVAAATAIAPGFAAPVSSSTTSAPAASSTVNAVTSDLDGLVTNLVNQGTILSSVGEELSQIVNLTSVRISSILNSTTNGLLKRDNSTVGDIAGEVATKATGDALGDAVKAAAKEIFGRLHFRDVDAGDSHFAKRDNSSVGQDIGQAAIRAGEDAAGDAATKGILNIFEHFLKRDDANIGTNAPIQNMFGPGPRKLNFTEPWRPVPTIPINPQTGKPIRRDFSDDVDAVVTTIEGIVAGFTERKRDLSTTLAGLQQKVNEEQGIFTLKKDFLNHDLASDAAGIETTIEGIISGLFERKRDVESDLGSLEQELESELSKIFTRSTIPSDFSGLAPEIKSALGHLARRKRDLSSNLSSLAQEIEQELRRLARRRGVDLD
ncbi:hypothetical protein CONPUDRAFT_73132 [Coniophora puteana RWD-64-598 SS2]|uniref:Uncharacterized protein n=1 Tax=Coniophora puteana (strain RWD-64-598) TaxID=741705 RepID=A0A5M3MQD3_CONPW|nr:uncharacterized protein CONPUDRAFT_73132 [Coniophora puteana RWD-64-598 SS2]EIW81389.1 hypothetical protein CONPUDRAFT_73132 [Coniophora puteana RWD-64-598 SS2]